MLSRDDWDGRMKTDEIRSRFLNFFKKEGHTIIPSDSLVPQSDPTLLFTGAGMNQFKDYFLGIKKDLKRAASSQKCLRTGDLDEVGRTPYHHSFFEMLGNFSFGDYFKKEAIQLAWDFLTGDLKISRERLRVSVHQDDEEAFKIWRDEIKIRPEWIYQMGDKTNFWPSNAPQEGPNGPCGPCSEIYYDQDPVFSPEKDIESSRFAEIWNLVFTQYDRQEGGELVPLGQKNIDTGMGLERLACVLQGKKTNYEIDIFQKINEAVENYLNIKVTGDSRKSLYAVSDHVRAVVFAIADGVIPSNEGRGYVIRKLIRRAIWNGFDIVPGKKGGEIFLSRLVPAVVQTMSPAYPELKEAEKSIIQTLDQEERRFSETVEKGRDLLFRKVDELKRKGLKILPGELAFELHDTYGFRYESTQYLAEKKGLSVDRGSFDKMMENQRQRAKEASKISGSIFVTSEMEKKLAALPATKFLGYATLESKSEVLFVEIKDGKGIVVLDQTPFYAESGGQIGDQGVLENNSFKARVIDTQKKDKCFIHSMEVEKGRIQKGDEVTARVDQTRRESAMRNHTATHLLHAALRKVLGNQVRQLGSLVSPEKLRFDYSYGQALLPGQLQEIEDLVNQEILKDTPVSKEEKTMDEAKGEGAIAFFGEKYGERVRVVTVPGFSKELCGGTHCERTGQIGSFLITSDTSIGSVIRRMEALTGLGALNYARSARNQISQLAQSLKTSPSKVTSRVAKLQEWAKKAEKGSSSHQVQGLTTEQVMKEVQNAGDVKFVAYQTEGLSLDRLRRLSDSLRSKSKATVYLLASKTEEKIYYLLGMSEDLRKKDLDLLKLFAELGPQLGASGGGRKDLVQAGGASAAAWSEKNWAEAAKTAIKYLRQLPLKG